MALIQAELIDAVAERAQLSPADVKRALSAFEEILLGELTAAVKSRFASIVQQMVGMKSAQDAPQQPPKAAPGEITVRAKSGASSRS